MHMLEAFDVEIETCPISPAQHMTLLARSSLALDVSSGDVVVLEKDLAVSLLGGTSSSRNHASQTRREQRSLF